MLPGGILNDGFALAWVSQRDRRAPALRPGLGAGARRRRRHAVRGEPAPARPARRQRRAGAPDAVLRSGASTTATTRRRSSISIDVPVFLAGAWQDEQTGPFFFPLLVALHVVAGDALHRLQRRAPRRLRRPTCSPSGTRSWSSSSRTRSRPVDSLVQRPVAAASCSRSSSRCITVQETEWARVQRRRSRRSPIGRREPPVRAIFERGAGKADELGAPGRHLRAALDRAGRRRTMKPQRALLPRRRRARCVAADRSGGGFVVRSRSRGRRARQPGAGRQRLGRAARLRLAPARRRQGGRLRDRRRSPATEVMAGTGSVDLWLESTVDDADLEVNLTEVRPDGKEMYVQSGWLRASYRKLGPRRDRAVAGAVVPRSRTGSRSCPARGRRCASASPASITSSAPARASACSSTRPAAAAPSGASRSSSSRCRRRTPSATTRSTRRASCCRVLDGDSAPTPLPPCPSLRGQPCRDYTQYQNRAAQ